MKLVGKKVQERHGLNQPFFCFHLEDIFSFLSVFNVIFLYVLSIFLR